MRPSATGQLSGEQLPHRTPRTCRASTQYLEGAMPLTDTAVRNAKPNTSKTLQLKDERGLSLPHKPTTTILREYTPTHTGICLHILAASPSAPFPPLQRSVPAQVHRTATHDKLADRSHRFTHENILGLGEPNRHKLCFTSKSSCFGKRTWGRSHARSSPPLPQRSNSGIFLRKYAKEIFPVTTAPTTRGNNMCTAAGVMGTGAYLPDGLLTNEELSGRFGLAPDRCAGRCPPVSSISRSPQKGLPDFQGGAACPSGVGRLPYIRDEEGCRTVLS